MANGIRISAPVLMIARGATVQVPIDVVLEQPVKVRGIYAKFLGAEETKADYTTTSTDSKGQTTTQHHTAVETVEITSRSWVLLGREKLGCLEGLKDTVATLFGGGKHEVMQPGQYPFEVEIAVPPDAPATVAGVKARIYYELSVQVDVPLGRDLRAVQAFSITPREEEISEVSSVRVQYPADEGRGYFGALFSPDVRIDLAIASDRYLVGDPLEGMFRIEAAKPLACRAIRARLVGVETSQAHGHSDSHTHRGPPIVIAEPGTLDGAFQQEFSLVADAPGPWSAKGQRFSIDWFLQVELDVPWARDPTIRAPITFWSRTQ